MKRSGTIPYKNEPLLINVRGVTKGCRGVGNAAQASLKQSLPDSPFE